MKQHFVTFYSPGTLFAEQSTKKIDSWDPDVAMEMARGIKERYGATPYGFRFSTRGRGPKDLDSSEIDRSPMYFLGGKIETIEEVRERNDPDERILLSNMEGNGYDRIIVNTNSWRVTQPFNDDDVLLDFEVDG